MIDDNLSIDRKIENMLNFSIDGQFFSQLNYSKLNYGFKTEQTENCGRIQMNKNYP